ncbi:MAG: hypothetical protein AB8H79_13385 [Myxococcota bacterium]
MKLVVIGAGDLGADVARRWVERGGEAIGITATPSRHDALRAWGIQPSTALPSSLIDPEDRVVLSISGSPAQLQAAQALQGTPFSRGVMTSSTAFHGHATGVRTPLSLPGETPRATTAAQAESAFHRLPSRTVVLRLGGLYRPGLGPLAALLRRGHPPLGPANKTLALMHRHDAATCILAALTHPDPDPTYLGVTPPYPTRQEFYEAACERHGLRPPEFNSTEDLRVDYDVSATQRDLLSEPAHPSWTDALDAG